MTWLNTYLHATYKDGARGPDSYDCWGLAREVRHAQYGKVLLPSWGHVHKLQPRAFTQAYRQESRSMEACSPEVGAIAAVFSGQLVTHVGVVIEVENSLAVLEITPGGNPYWGWVSEFESKNLKVVYYRDKCIPVEA